MNKKRLIYRIVLLCLILSLMVFIFVYSAQPSDASHDASAGIVTGIVDPRWLNVNGEIFSYNVSNLQFALSGRGSISRNQSEGIFNRIIRYLF